MKNATRGAYAIRACMRGQVLEGWRYTAASGRVYCHAPRPTSTASGIFAPGPKNTVAEYFELHPRDPQPRLIRRAAEVVRAGGLIAYPTDSCYALGWQLGDKGPLERVRRIRQADRHHHYTWVCSSLAEVGRFARIETWQFRMLHACLPGPYTFLLHARRALPRRLQHERRRTIGVRIPSHRVTKLLLAELGEPFMRSTLLLGGDSTP